MTYTATISSQGQITIPAKVRRELGFGKTVTLEIVNGTMTIKPAPTSEQIWAILDAPSKGPGLSENEKNSQWVQTAIERDARKRDH